MIINDLIRQGGGDHAEKGVDIQREAEPMTRSVSRASFWRPALHWPVFALYRRRPPGPDVEVRLVPEGREGRG